MSNKKLKVGTAIILVIVVLLSFAGCGGATKKEVPNVFGMDYESAIIVLESKGFKVTAIEQDAETVLKANRLSHLEAFKGKVFKINDVFRDYFLNDIKTNDIIIYYAKEDYIPEKPDNNDNDTNDKTAAVNATAAATTKIAETKAPTSTKAPAATKAQSNNSEWKKFLQDYEKWVDNYIKLMKKYQTNPADTSLLAEYMKALEDLTDWAERASKLEIELANNPVALSEYLEILARIINKLSQIN